METDWFKRKFINPRAISVNSETQEEKLVPQTEKLEYARELFEGFGKQDARFSGAVIVGSVMKGYALDKSSDIDVKIFFEDQEEATNNPLSSSVYKDFSQFVKDFQRKKENEEKKSFIIDVRPSIFANLLYTVDMSSSGEIEIPTKKLLQYGILFYDLSFPIIASKNTEVLTPMKKLLEAMKKAVQQLNPEQKAELLEDIMEKVDLYAAYDFQKHILRTENKPNRKEYFESRKRIIAKRIKSKFGLS